MKKKINENLNIGDRIKLTWLPNPINNPEEKSCYIGTVGTVRDIDNEGFYLTMDSGATLIIGKKYKFEKVNNI